MHVPRPAVHLAAGLLLLGTAASGCSGGGDDPPFDSLPVKVGFKTDRPGMSEFTDKGVYDGFEPHLTMKVLGSRKLDYTSLTVTTANWEDALTDGKANHNKVDLVVADVSERDSLKRDYDLAGPYLQTPLGVLLKAGDTRAVAKSEDLKPLRVCVTGGTTAEAQLKDIGPRVTVTGTDLRECLARVDDDTADAVLSDYLVLQGVAANSGGGGQRAYRVARDAHIGKTQFLMMVLPKGHRKACELLRGAINDYLQDPDWMNALRTSFGFGPDFTDKELRDTFKPVTTSAGDRCSA
ncbi:transporter substrate-binding domain-containing protein [Kitasatospora sp. NA04385]|uniref:transporter substrate-binding domain-containing protein n=1 Tax=Kitasatospora sp. NA04385 TaxID=2742135 RepID=UPI001591E36C|nr:transporter substrate-binding domain-containing protein [Kitasatospora sp. NA04385]QKW19231.1 transporter substrate-binding domain-containing protein [Kitasatospora sp. NA04385]